MTQLNKMQSICVLNLDQNIYLKSSNWTDSMKSSASWTKVKEIPSKLMIILITFIIIY